MVNLGVKGGEALSESEKPRNLPFFLMTPVL